MMLATYLTSCCVIVSVMAIPLNIGRSITKRDVWTPKVLSPSEETVWIVGSRYNVTWDTTNPPKQITNSVGRVILRNTAGFLPGAGGFNEPLASNFSIFEGVVEVEVPDVPGDDDYQVVLFGDSGNTSPFFKIANPMIQLDLFDTGV